MTKSLHANLEAAYQHFNLTLFDGRLPECMLLVHRKKNARGYFWANQWSNTVTREGRHEIAMNPDTFEGRSVKDVLSTLVHEMVHLDQQVNGTPGKRGYHNKEWVDMMMGVGLLAYAVKEDKPVWNGSCFDRTPKCQTGTRVSHVVIPGSFFDASCDTLISTGVTIEWLAKTVSAEEKALAKTKRASKTKFTCPECSQNAWAKPDASLACGFCGVEMEDQA